MARAIFQTIYDNVKQSIDDGTYAYQSYLPSETELTQLFDCSRMTVRRAISMLAADGYVLPQQGKGMRVIRNISDETRPLRKSQPVEALSSKRLPLSLSSSSVTRRSPRLPGFLKAVSSRVPNASVMQTDGPCAPTTPIT